MAVTYKVTYNDGRMAITTATPKVEIAVEDQFYKLRQGKWLQWIYRLAWQGLTFAGEETRSFDEWVDVVQDVSAVDEPADPTLPVQALTDSSDSVSEPDSVSMS